MITLRTFRATSLVLFCFYSCIGSSQGVDVNTTNVRSPAYSPENHLRINLKEFKSIHISANPEKAEENMARMLQKKMESLYKITLNVKAGLPDKNEATILVGREQALSSGIVTEKELNSVRLDGYVIKGTENRIVIAGHAPQGTIYGAYAFLRQIGLKIYPWHYSPDDSIEVFTPLENGIIKAFSISSKPYFEHRDMQDHLDRGRFGGTIRQYSLGDLRFAQEHEYFRNNGYLGWDHTAGYLVPIQLYHDKHPEYFAVDKKGGGIPKSTPNLRVNTCVCLPDVVDISTRRALEWISTQKDRRYFAITDGDANARCPSCELSDPIPDYHTDRILTWVNAVARTVRKKHPEKILLTAAYQKTVKPPLRTALEPNVLVMYAPWYWNSRSTSAVGFAHPLNVIAMEEFMGWSMLFPAQMGVYDYPGDWIHGTAERIKFYAQNKVRWLYFNAPEGNLLHWVNSQLLWDPLLDTEELESEFVQAFYGPAADTMERYLRLLKTTIETNSWYSKKFFRESASLQKARSLLYRAVAIAEAADLNTQTRILEGVTGGLHTILMSTHPTQADVGDMKKDFERYIKLNQRILSNCERLQFNESLLDRRRKTFNRNLASLGINLPKENQKSGSRAEQEQAFKRAISGFDDFLTKSTPPPDIFPTSPKTSVTVAFSSTDEPRKWRFEGSQTDLVSPPIMAIFNNPARERLRGVKVHSPLSRLPVLPRGNIKIHAGRFYAERIFDPPLDVDGHFFLDFHLHASCDVPVTIYINKNIKLRSDVDLHAGEQIVRIDFRNYDSDLLDYIRWDRKIKSIGFDIWPQDYFYPYPKVQDTEIIFLGMEAKNYDPEPALLPYKGKAIWMSHFRANIPHETDVFQDLFSSYRKLMMRDPKNKFYLRDNFSSWKSEKFRTFTEHRIVSPIFAILTDKDSPANDKEAARTIQKYLMKAYGVELPINPPGLSANPYTGNMIILGKAAALATEKIKPIELKHVGEEGFVIRARNGRIIIAGENGSGTFFGVAHLLEEHGARFLIPGIREKIPDMRNGFLHELYLLDWPYFKNRQIPCGNLLMTQSPQKSWKNMMSLDTENFIMAEQTASAIKNIAQRGKNEIPHNVVSDAVKSPLSCYVAAKLLWNPFTDTTRLIREFREDLDP